MACAGNGITDTNDWSKISLKKTVFVGESLRKFMNESSWDSVQVFSERQASKIPSLLMQTILASLFGAE